MYKLNVIEIFVLVLCFVLILWFGGCAFLVPTLEISKIDAITVDNLLNKVQNGDLIFLAGKSQGERAIRFFHSSYYSHMGMIFVDERNAVKDANGNVPVENKIFIWEADLGQGSRSGPRVMKLADKLKRWKGEKIGMWKRYINETRPSTKDILSVVQLYLSSKIHMDLSMVSWFFARWPKSALFKYFKMGDGDGENVFCSELMVATLQKLDIIDSDKHPSWYSPEDFVRDKVPLAKGTYGVANYFTF